MIVFTILAIILFGFLLFYFALKGNKQDNEWENIKKQQDELLDKLKKQRNELLDRLDKDKKEESPEKKHISKYKAPYLEEYKGYFIAQYVISEAHICEDGMVFFRDYLSNYDVLIKKPSKKLLLTKSIYSEVYNKSFREWKILYISNKFQYTGKNLSDCKARIDIKDKSE